MMDLHLQLHLRNETKMPYLWRMKACVDESLPGVVGWRRRQVRSHFVRVWVEADVQHASL